MKKMMDQIRVEFPGVLVWDTRYVYYSLQQPKFNERIQDIFRTILHRWTI
jgi:hypothetical protein